MLEFAPDLLASPRIRVDQAVEVRPQARRILEPPEFAEHAIDGPEEGGTAASDHGLSHGG
jgi:hypothetical protein